MSEPRRILVGVLPTADTIFTDGADAVATMLREASVALDRARADEERARSKAAIDAVRVQNTRRARAARRFRRALKVFARLR
jgi:hypothetical protein